LEDFVFCPLFQKITCFGSNTLPPKNALGIFGRKGGKGSEAGEKQVKTSLKLEENWTQKVKTRTNKGLTRA
jgi:hypothetical protein